MGGNSKGGVRTNLARNFALYDAMPPHAREVVRNAMFDYNVTALAKDARKMSPAMFRTKLIYADMKIARREAARHYGAQADDYIAAQGSRKPREWTDSGNGPRRR